MRLDSTFGSRGPIVDRLLCWRYSVKVRTKNTLRSAIRGRGSPGSAALNTFYGPRTARRLLLKKKMAISGSQPSWFYSAYDRGSSDPMTNETLARILKKSNSGDRILVTGCGTGLTVFHLLEHGFSNVSGTDLLPECVEVAVLLNKKFYGNLAVLLVDNGFQPQVAGEFDVVLALHWVFSAWSGNYGNSASDDSFNEEIRRDLLNSFLGVWSSRIVSGGLLIVELIDAICDVRLPSDHPYGLGQDVYPVRHSLGGVSESAALNGFTVESHYLSYSYGHQARMCYWLRRR